MDKASAAHSKTLKSKDSSSKHKKEPIGLVLSGGGSRGAYQVGALAAIKEYLDLSGREINVVVGSSLGAINGIVLAASASSGLQNAIELLEALWRERTYRNTFRGSVSRSFLKAMHVAILRYHSPGPCPSNVSIFDPYPLKERLSGVLEELGGLRSDQMPRQLRAAAVMTTLEGANRRPMLLTCASTKIPEARLKGATFDMVSVPELTAEHGFASAALPSVLPAVDLNIESREVRLIDGGICDNIPVDPAVRLGADSLIVIDSSGRRWWFDHYGDPHYSRPTWEVPAETATYCMRPNEMIECMNIKPFGPLLQEAVGASTKDFISAVGPTWPIFRILKHKMGERLAYEVMSYVALHPEYIGALIELGYQEAKTALEQQTAIDADIPLAQPA